MRRHHFTFAGQGPNYMSTDMQKKLILPRPEFELSEISAKECASQNGKLGKSLKYMHQFKRNQADKTLFEKPVEVHLQSASKKKVVVYKNSFNFPQSQW